MAAFHEFSSLSSALRRRGWLPFTRNRWMLSLAVHHGLAYYYGKRGRPLPRFSDFLEPDAEARIARSLGIQDR